MSSFQSTVLIMLMLCVAVGSSLVHASAALRWFNLASLKPARPNTSHNYAVILFPGARGVDNDTLFIEREFIDASDVSFCCYDWKKARGTQLTAAFDGQRVGRQAANEFARNLSDLHSQENATIHAIGISVGAFAADSFTKMVRSLLPPTTTRIRLTLLDPFTSRGVFEWSYGAKHFGTSADYCEVYLNTDDPVPFTNKPLPNAYTFDVTHTAERSTYQPEPGSSMHSWPAAYFGRHWRTDIDPRRRNVTFTANHAINPRGSVFIRIISSLRTFGSIPRIPRQATPVIIFANLSSMPRLIYNRVAKAGSTAMVVLLTALSKINNFTVVEDNNYFPSKAVLAQHLDSLPDNSVYINHCNYFDGLPPNEYTWINVVRNPIELEESNFYYAVSSKRGYKGGDERAGRRSDPCGCEKDEFDKCIKMYLVHDECAYRLHFIYSMRSYFSEATDFGWPDKSHRFHPNFTAQMAFERAQRSYRFIGLLEEYELTIKAFEKLIPRFFANASAIHASMSGGRTHPNRTPEKNPYTGTSMNGAISTHVREALTHYNAGDMALYANIKRMFWWKVTRMFPEEPLVHFPAER